MIGRLITGTVKGARNAPKRKIQNEISPAPTPKANPYRQPALARGVKAAITSYPKIKGKARQKQKPRIYRQTLKS